MATYTITIDNDAVAGLTWALERYNAGLPAEIDDPDKPGSKIANPSLLADEAAYVQHVMSSAAQSYLVQQGSDLADKVRTLAPKQVVTLKAAIEAAVAVDAAEKAAAVEVVGGGAVRVGP